MVPPLRRNSRAQLGPVLWIRKWQKGCVLTSLPPVVLGLEVWENFWGLFRMGGVFRVYTEARISGPNCDSCALWGHRWIRQEPVPGYQLHVCK